MTKMDSPHSIVVVTFKLVCCAVGQKLGHQCWSGAVCGVTQIPGKTRVCQTAPSFPSVLVACRSHVCWDDNITKWTRSAQTPTSFAQTQGRYLLSKPQRLSLFMHHSPLSWAPSVSFTLYPSHCQSLRFSLDRFNSTSVDKILASRFEMRGLLGQWNLMRVSLISKSSAFFFLQMYCLVEAASYSPYYGYNTIPEAGWFIRKSGWIKSFDSERMSMALSWP